MKPPPLLPATELTPTPANDDALDLFLDGARVVGDGPTAPSACEVRRAAGRRAKVAGDDFERWLTSQHGLARMERLVAELRKVEVPTRWTTLRCRCGARHKVLTFAGKACADFLGVTPSGLPLAIEAKSVEGPTGGRLYLHDVLEQQREQLALYERIGGVAILAVEFRETGRVLVRSTICAVRWGEVPWRTRRSAESIELGDAHAWKVPPQQLYLRRFLRP